MRGMSTTINQKIRSALLLNGKTLSGWARENGFKPRTVSQILWRFGGKSSTPEGNISRQIVKSLESYTGMKICGK